MLVLGIAAIQPSALAHVAPSVDTNNQYLKLAPMRDRVRLAYTVYIGEIPGAQARGRMDENRDGRVEDREARAYGDRLAEAVKSALAITVDGAAVTVEWAEIHVGMGTPATNAGSFSVDLIAWLCGDPDRLEHELVLFNRYRLQSAGETELRVQHSPGITVTRSSLGPNRAKPDLELLWHGSSEPLQSLGYYLDYAVDPQAAMAPPDAHCGAGGAAPPAATRIRITAGLLGAAAIALVVALVLRARKRASVTGPRS